MRIKRKKPGFELMASGSLGTYSTIVLLLLPNTQASSRVKTNKALEKLVGLLKKF